MIRSIRSVAVVYVFAAILGSTITHVRAQRLPNASRKTIPPGFTLDDTAGFWQDGPWVFTGGTNGTAVAGLHHDAAGTDRPIRVRLDDGSSGDLRVVAGPCVGHECDPDDCGCFAPDSFWVDIADARGQRVTHRHLWAAYGVFDVVPVDLIDGPGDELVIVRIPNRGAPPHAPELKIWKLGSATPADLVEDVDDWFAGRFNTVEGAIPCARWRTRLFVKPEDPKPRPIALHADLAAVDWPPSGCHLRKEGARRAAVIRAPRVLSFERGRYRMR